MKGLTINNILSKVETNPYYICKTITLGTIAPNNPLLTLYNGVVLTTKCNASCVLIRVGE